MKYGIDELKKLSSDKGIVFADYLRQLMMEDLLYRVIPVEKPASFVLENDIVLREESKNRRVEQPIGFVVKTDLDTAGFQFRDCLKQEGDFSWRVCHETLEEDRLLLRISVEGILGDYRIPFVVTILERSNQPIHIDLGTYRGIIHRESLDYKVCAPEIRLAECIYMILTQLELISSMEYYEDALSIISNYSVDGRRVADELAQRIENLDSKIIETIQGYASYKYMEKRWNSYKKNKAFNENRKDSREMTTWQDALACLMKFLEPIALAICEKRIFIGDWMPELGRFM